MQRPLLAAVAVPALLTCLVTAACGASVASSERFELRVTSAQVSAAHSVARQHVHRAANHGAREVEPTEEELETRRTLVDALIAEREYDAAIRQLDYVLEARPRWWSAHAARAQALLFGRADVSGAAQHATRCLELYPGNGTCLALRGAVRQERGELDGAVADLRLAVEFEPDHPWALDRLARLELARGDVSAALETVDRALEREPTNVGLRILAATIYERAAQHERAERTYRWVARNHRDPQLGARYLLAFLERAGRTDEAQRLRRSLESADANARPTRELRPLR